MTGMTAGKPVEGRGWIPLRIAHNIMALNTWRNLNETSGVLSKTLERLSSGLRINRAADDAAGLAISEKMRAQIRGLNMAAKNAQDAISLIQTAEGALNETHSILQRMRELAVQAANDTNTPADREQIQKEIDQLSQEISRIGATTEFNTMKLLNGTFKGTFHIGANENQNITLEIGDMRGYALGVAGAVTYQAKGNYSKGNDTTSELLSGTYSVQYDAWNDEYQLVDSNGLVVATSSDGGKTYTAKGGDDTVTFQDAVTFGTVTLDTSQTTGAATGIASVTNQGMQAGVYTAKSLESGQWQLLDSSGQIVAQSTDGLTFTDAAGNVLFKLQNGSGTTPLTDGMKLTVRGVDVTTQLAANKAVTTVQQALDAVSTQRSALGAYQNRLEHTVANLSVASENLSAAESRIRDADMAQEMMEFVRNQILLQSGTAMLAQANAVPQTVLQLLA